MSAPPSERSPLHEQLHEVCEPDALARLRVRRALARTLASGQLSDTVLRVEAGMARRAAGSARSGGLGASATSVGVKLGASLSALAIAAGLLWLRSERPQLSVQKPAASVSGSAQPVRLAARPELPTPVAAPSASPSAELAPTPTTLGRHGSSRASSVVGMQHNVATDTTSRQAGYGLDQETALVRGAADALRRGDTNASFAFLAEHARRFPQGALWQECAALHVLAACAHGPNLAALRERSSYLRSAGHSPLAERVRRACLPGSAAPATGAPAPSAARSVTAGEAP